MTITTPENEQRLRRGFKYFNFFMIGLWRLGLGSWVNLWPKVGGRILVITHTGRKTGKRRHTPVNYAILNGEIYCTAGFGSISDWYKNILLNPQVEIWLPDSWWVGLAEDASDHPERKEILRQVLISSGFAAKAFEIDPQTMTDEDLEALLLTYRIIHIRRSAARTGKGGPGDLSWVWPLTTFLFFFMYLFKRPHKR